jgi:regulator of cell morphogenesis and NO signaling
MTTPTANPPQEDTRHWSLAPLPELIDHILETHHVYMRTVLPRIETLLKKLMEAHEDRHGDTLRSIAAVFTPMKAELEGHLAKEEMVLFPWVRNLAGGRNEGFHCGTLRNPIRVMLYEHDAAGEALVQLHRITGGFVVPEGACSALGVLYRELGELERDLRRHIHLENDILFPRAIALE